MGKQWFHYLKQAAIGVQVKTGVATLTNFYDGATGTLTRLAVSAAAQGTNRWKGATPPEFTLTATGGEIYGALFHLVKHDPNSFVVVVERIDSGGSAPASGNLALTWTRRGWTIGRTG